MSRWIATFLAGALALLTTLAGTAQAQQGYKLHIGDTVQMEVLEDPTLNRSLLVAPDGRVSAPQAGGIQASGDGFIDERLFQLPVAVGLGLEEFYFAVDPVCFFIQIDGD